MTTLNKFLDTALKIKDLGKIYYFLGLEITKEHSFILISQHKFIVDLLSKFHGFDVFSVVAPLDPHVKLSAELGDLLPDYFFNCILSIQEI